MVTRARNLLPLVVLIGTLMLGAFSQAAGADAQRQRVLVETTDVCVIYPNEYNFPDLAEVRHPEIVRYRYLGLEAESSGALLWLPGRPGTFVTRLIVVTAPPLPNHCAIPLGWPE